MARQCSVCSHKDRHSIDMALVEGSASERALAKRYGITSSSLHRHAENHVPKLLASVAERVGMLEAEQVMAQALRLYERSLELLSEAEANVSTAGHSEHKSRALSAATGAIRETRQVLETLTKVAIAVRQEDLARERADSTPVKVEQDLSAEIRAALERRGMRTQGPRALPPSEQEPTDAEIVDAS